VNSRAIPVVLMATAQALTSAQTRAEAPQRTHECRLLLEVSLEPGVPDERDAGFLSSLANRPGYVLTWLGESRENMTVTMELSGPGPEYLCYEEVEIVGRDARVLGIKVLPIDGLKLAAE